MIERVKFPFYNIYRSTWRVLDWLYPPICGGCGIEGTQWCENCSDATKVITATVCQKCGDFLDRGNICRYCQLDPPAFIALRSYTEFSGPIRKALHRMKYHRDIALGVVLAGMLQKLMLDNCWQPDLIAPIPISKERFYHRGYNQSAFLALPLALSARVPYSSRIIRRTRDTRSQVGLGIAERRDNVARAFTCDSKNIQSRCILLVDDVITTGATMRACASALMDSGAEKVFGMSIARAKYLDDDPAVQVG